MSLATFKKKTAHKYKNNSVDKRQFSINGTRRNQGYIGQTSLSRNILRTPASGPALQGHGTCCGEYPMKTVFTSSIFSTNDPTMVKSSVLGTKGMLQKRTQWARRPQPFSSTKPSESLNLHKSSDITAFRKQQALEKCEASGYKPAGKCCAPNVKQDLDVHVAISSSDYITRLRKSCAELDTEWRKYKVSNKCSAPLP